MRQLLLPIAVAVTLAACNSGTPAASNRADDIFGTETSIADDGTRSTGDKLGLKSKEVALTLDDGPVPGSLEIAKWLSDEKIPVTYFMIGQNVRNNLATAQAIASLPGVSIANHSWDHKRKLNSVVCIACDGADYAIREVADADKVLSPLFAKSKTRFKFFRAPGGNFFRAGNAAEMAQLAQLNKAISDYVGPVRWDVDGDVNPPSSGGCDGSSVSATACRDIYMRQVRALKSSSAVILAHDIHAKSREMIKLLVGSLRAEGYSFVPLDKSPETVAAIGKVQQLPGSTEFGATTFAATQKAPGTYAFDITAKGAARIEVWVDRKTDGPLLTAEGEELHQTVKFTVGGTRFFTIKGFSATQQVIAQAERSTTIQL